MPLLERDARLEARQRRAQAQVAPVAQRELTLDLAVDVERVGIPELALVATRVKAPFGGATSTKPSSFASSSRRQLPVTLKYSSPSTSTVMLSPVVSPSPSGTSAAKSMNRSRVKPLPATGAAASMSHDVVAGSWIMSFAMPVSRKRPVT